MYQVRLIKNGVVEKYLNEIFNVRLSSERLTGISFFKREPRRLSFEVFADEWLMNNILNGEEICRDISPYYIKLYSDGDLEYTGIIILSSVGYDIKTGIIKITSYDNLKFFDIFRDIKIYQYMTYPRNYFTNSFGDGLMDYIKEKIENKIPIIMSFDYEIPTSEYKQYNLFSVDIEDAFRKAKFKYDLGGVPEDQIIIREGFEFVWVLRLYYFQYGVIVYDNKKYYVLRMYRIFPNLGWSLYREEYDMVDLEDDEDGNEESTTDNKYTDIFSFYDIDIDDLFNIKHINSDEYYYQESTGNWTKDIYFYGNRYNEKVYISDKVAKYPEKMPYEKGINVIQAILLYYNLAMYADKTGIIHIKNKENVGSISVVIDRNDIISLKYSRLAKETPNMNELDILSGNNEILKDELEEYYADYFNRIKKIDIIIDNQYNLELGDVIIIEGEEYIISEIDYDKHRDEYKIKGWRYGETDMG